VSLRILLQIRTEYWYIYSAEETIYTPNIPNSRAARGGQACCDGWTSEAPRNIYKPNSVHKSKAAAVLKLEGGKLVASWISRVNTGHKRRLLACAQGRQDHADRGRCGPSPSSRNHNNSISVHTAECATPNHAVGLSSAFITSSDTTSHIISSTEHRISWATSPSLLSEAQRETAPLQQSGSCCRPMQTIYLIVCMMHSRGLC